MGQKTRGGMWCTYCQRPVMGIAETHRATGAATFLAIPALTGLGGGSNFACPTCGGKVRPKRWSDKPGKA